MRRGYVVVLGGVVVVQGWRLAELMGVGLNGF